MRTILTPEVRQDIKADRAAGMTRLKIAQKYRCCEATVTNVLGPICPDRHRRPEGDMAELYKAVAADYVKKFKTGDIAAKHNIHITQIYSALQWVEAHGVKIPRRGRL